jgi:hypothetical protein
MMSTLAYAALTKRRLSAPSGTSTSISPPGIGTYIDVVAALVPAEVLALHATIFSLTTKTDLDQAGNSITTITEPGTLRWAFWGFILLSVVLYIFPQFPIKARLDYLRAIIPPAAFFAWTMLQKATAFDAVFPGVSEVHRTVIALFGAVVLGAMAKALADKANKPRTPAAGKAQA